MGLLSIASHLDDKPKQGLAFSDFILKYNLKTCAVLEKSDNDYIVSNSIGFDGDSILASISSFDFWQGICPDKDKIYSFSFKENSLTPLLQLFSLKMKEQLSEIFIIKNSESRILLVCNTALSEILNDFPSSDSIKHKCSTDVLNKFVKEASVLLKFQINLNEAVESFVLSHFKGNSSIREKLESSLYNEFYNRFICILNQKDASYYPENGIINTVFITDKTYSTELIINHLIVNFREIIGECAELSEINFIGKAEAYRDIADFLQAD